MAKETRTYEQRKAYLAKMTNIRRRRLKKIMIDYKGGKCYFCGYSTYYGALDFHHTDESNKNFSLSTDKLYRAWSVIMSELEKCVLLCSNCHRELHGGLRQIVVK